MSAQVLWMNIPLMVVAFGLWVGVPLWLVLRHPDGTPRRTALCRPTWARSSGRPVLSGQP